MRPVPLKKAAPQWTIIRNWHPPLALPPNAGLFRGTVTPSRLSIYLGNPQREA